MADDDIPKRARRGGARPNSGGKREGAGRKPVDLTQKKVTFPSRVLPSTLATIKADARNGENVGEVVDRWAMSLAGGRKQERKSDP